MFDCEFGRIQLNRTYFHQLEALWSALEEICFPPPKNFTTHIGFVAYDVLPRKLFMQYVSRGVVHVTDSLAKYIFSHLTCPRQPTTEPGQWGSEMTETDQQFFALLLKKYQDGNAVAEMKFHERMTAGLKVPSIFEFYHSVAGKHTHDSNILLSAYNRVSDGTTVDAFSRLSLHQQSEDEQALIFCKQTNPELLAFIKRSRFAPMTFFLLSLIMPNESRATRASEVSHQRTESSTISTRGSIAFGFSLFSNGMDQGNPLAYERFPGNGMFWHNQFTESEMAHFRERFVEYVTENVANMHAQDPHMF